MDKDNRKSPVRRRLGVFALLGCLGLATLVMAGFAVDEARRALDSEGRGLEAGAAESMRSADASRGPADAGHISPLPVIEGVVRFTYSSLDHIAPDAYVQRAAGDGNEVVLLDIREPAEYAVSHLPGALQVGPDADAATVLARARDVRGKRVVVYCSVGVRSSKLASRVAADLKKAGAQSVENLSGGIFRWHNERRPLVDRTGAPTDLVHKYDAYWGKLLRRPDQAVLPDTNG